MTSQRTVAVSVWPLRWYLELGVLPTAVPCARKHARLVLAEWGLRELADPAELVVSELDQWGQSFTRITREQVRRAVVGREPPVRLWLQSDYRTVLVQVWDGNNRMPTQQEPDPESEGGRGLWLVEAVTRTGEHSSRSTRAGKWYGPH